MKIEFDKKYNPLDFEEEIYSKWLQNSCFYGDVNSKKKSFTIVMPPPNITGKLHMGHALDETLQDILIRFKRMNGFEALWAPGVDHASIATEAKIVQKLQEEGLTKEKIGREEFLKRAFLWKEEYEGNIINQLKKLGVSCDWTRQRFTMDDGFADAVLEFFVRLYQDGLIYKGEKIINWCYCCKTSISDIEVEHKEINGAFYNIKYELEDGTDFLEVATTRPETIFADVAVAVNPDDGRYSKYIGKKVIVPIINKKVPVIADSYVDIDFGTGVLKITPGHDPNDFEVGKRHNLELINLFDENGCLNSFAGEFEGLNTKKARVLVVKRLKELGLLLKVDEIVHNVGHCYRCHEQVQPILSMQWFVKMESLKGPAIDVVKQHLVSFIPKRFEKTYFNWMENIKDWCISRQLWWGHKIPAFYCENCGFIDVAKKKPLECKKCGAKELKQDEDTLDTWFSSAVWPYGIFGWPNEKEKDYEKFYPTDVLVTGYDIIFFWVARMIFSAIYNTKKIPFKKVFIHGLVRDEQGRKMSKSLGNGVDPLEIIKEYGADALRFNLASGINAGNDLRFSKKKVLASRNFANKLWNASRFIFMQFYEGFKIDFEYVKNCECFAIEDEWIIFKLDELICEVTKNIEDFEISVATQKLYDFIWDVFCDWYIEIFKIKSKDDISQNLNILIYVLDVVLKLLHPFMPFITQKIYFAFHDENSFICFENWPKPLNYDFEKTAKEFEVIMKVVKSLRNLRATTNLKKDAKFPVYIETKEVDVFKKSENIIKKLGRCSEINLNADISKEANFKNLKKIVVDTAIIYVFVDDFVDVEKQQEELLKEKSFLEKEILMFEKKLANENFIKKAPKEVVEKEKSKLKLKKQKLDNILKGIKN